MERLKQFEVSFGGLSLGKHQFAFDISDKFFAYFDHTIIQHGKLQVALTLTKQTHMLTFDFNIKGTIHVECDRCSDEFELPIELAEQMIVKFGDEAKEEDMDVFVIPHSETHINIAQQIYEYITVALPMHIVHPDDAKGKSTCNKAVLKELENINKVAKKIKEEKLDPRWDALKNISLK